MTSVREYGRQKITSNCRQKNECKCKKPCSRTCGCQKLGRRCSIDCFCGTSCNNVFNGLDYFFGSYHRCTATPCFISYLTKHGANGFNTIDRDELRDRILKNGSCMNIHLDKEIVEWKKQCDVVKKSGNAINRLTYTQNIFRLLLSNESTIYYSFCDNEMHRKSCYWHCLICKKCEHWRIWHCGRCKKCQFGLNKLCDTCGESFATKEN